MGAKQIPLMQRGESSTILGQRYSLDIAVDLVADTPQYWVVDAPTLSSEKVVEFISRSLKTKLSSVNLRILLDSSGYTRGAQINTWNANKRVEDAPNTALTESFSISTPSTLGVVREIDFAGKDGDRKNGASGINNNIGPLILKEDSSIVVELLSEETQMVILSYNFVERPTIYYPVL